MTTEKDALISLLREEVKYYKDLYEAADKGRDGWRRSYDALLDDWAEATDHAEAKRQESSHWSSQYFETYWRSQGIEAERDEAERERDEWRNKCESLETAVSESMAAADKALSEARREGQIEALREVADDINSRVNDPFLITAADKWAGYYSGIRTAMQVEESALRSLADRIENGADQ